MFPLTGQRKHIAATRLGRCKRAVLQTYRRYAAVRNLGYLINMATNPTTYQASPLQLTPFNDLEDELFGAPGTPERTAYEDRVTLELLPKSIREYRHRNHLTQDELGQRLGVQKSQISKLERNPSNVTLDTLRRVFRALNVEVTILLQPAPTLG